LVDPVVGEVPVLFQTPEFVALFLLTIAGFYYFARKFRLHVLAIASLAFYAFSGIPDFIILLTTIAGTYLLSKRVKPGGDLWPIYIAIFLLIASLGYFKYSEFIYTNLNRTVGTFFLPTRSVSVSSLLPLGISFYSFQIVGYFIDLHKGRTKHAKSLLEYTVFVSFFAQLIAGPIMRGRGYLPQLGKLKGGTRADFKIGSALVVSGLFKKIVLADYFIGDKVDHRFLSTSFDQPEVLAVAGLFAFQIYLDFSGYVDIARGLARMVGLKLPQNFRTPYLAKNPAEFWQRWHITLSDWVRDYLYIPLGGNRRGRLRETSNLLIVMLIVGIWHGAGWTYAL